MTNPITSVNHLSLERPYKNKAITIPFAETIKPQPTVSSDDGQLLVSTGLIELRKLVPSESNNHNRKEKEDFDSTLSPANLGKFKRNRLLQAVKDSSD